MNSPERKILIPDGDSFMLHPAGVCNYALKLRDEILRQEDVVNGKIYSGRCSRRNGIITGCLIEIIPTSFGQDKVKLA